MHGQTIVVGVGGTDASWQTLAWAVSDAAITGRRIHVCRVGPADSRLTAYRRIPVAVLEVADPQLARAISTARARLGGDRVDLTITHGHVGEALVRIAACADLVVVGAPQRPGWVSRSSTVHYVMAHAQCPTVVVREATGRPRGPLAGHVVVGVDGSAPSRAALEFGFGYAAAHRQPLAAVHVSGLDREDVWFEETTPQTHIGDMSNGLVLLADEVRPLRYEYPSVDVRRALYGGRPLPGLLRAAAGARLLVVGDRGRGLPTRMLLGSVGHGVVDRADCPVAVVHAAELSTATKIIDPRAGVRVNQPAGVAAGVT